MASPFESVGDCGTFSGDFHCFFERSVECSEERATPLRIRAVKNSNGDEIERKGPFPNVDQD